MVSDRRLISLGGVRYTSIVASGVVMLLRSVHESALQLLARYCRVVQPANPKCQMPKTLLLKTCRSTWDRT